MTAAKKQSVEGWIRSVVAMAITVLSTWQLFTKEIHGYMDTRMDEMEQRITTRLSDQLTGQMYQVLDSIRTEFDADREEEEGEGHRRNRRRERD